MTESGDLVLAEAVLERHDRVVQRLRNAATARTVTAGEFNNAVREAYRLGMPQGRIGALVGLTQARISQIISDGTEFLT